MADVNLSVEVLSTGVQKAIADIRALREGGVVTAKSMKEMAARSKEMAAEITSLTNAARGTGATFEGVDKALTKSGKTATSLVAQLRELEAAYKQIAMENVGASPAERLALGGGAAVAKQMAEIQASMGASATGDANTVQQERLTLLREELATTRELNAARATRQSATTDLTRNREDLANQRSGISAVEQATVQLTRANQDLAQAEKVVADATAQNRSGGRFAKEDAQYINEQVSAFRQEAGAIAAVTSAERQLEQATTATTAAARASATAQASALAARESANVNISRAREDYASQSAGLNAVERAEIALTRAVQDRTRAEEARKATGISGTNSARTAALNEEAGAIRKVTEAETALKEAQANHSPNADNGNAFQSSFSYFIIAGAAQKAAQAIEDFGTAAVGTASQMERAFVDVNRTFDGTDQQLASLKAKLIDLSTSTPNSFVDLAQIAQLGNQLGIAQQNIESFTTTIAQYTAISGESADSAATAFGQISNLTGLAASEYGNLASSIAYVARTTVATEHTIQNTAKEITALASGAGFSAQGIVGLAGALSSLAIPPERARGSLSLYFGALNRAVSEGGPKLAAFATLTGKSADEIAKLVAANKGQEVFTSFISGLSQLNNVAKTSALHTLGLSTIRVDQTMRALSQNVPLLTSSLAGADKAFQANTETGRQFAKIQDAMATKFAEFQHSVSNAAGAIGNALAPAVLSVIPAITQFVVGFEKFANNPWGAAILKIVGAVGVLSFAILTLVGGLALAKAAMTVIPWSLTGLHATGATGAIARFTLGLLGMNAEAKDGVIANVGLASSFKGVGIAAETSSLGVRGFKFALAGTGVGLLILAIGALAEGFMSAADAAAKAKSAGTDFLSNTSEIGTALQKDQATYQKTGQAIGQITTKVETNKISADKWVGSLNRATDGQANLDASTTHTTKAITAQTVAYGDHAKAALSSSLRNSDTFKNLFKDTKANANLKDIGFSPIEFTKALLGSDPVNGGKNYAKSLMSGLVAQTKLDVGSVAGVMKLLDRGVGTSSIASSYGVSENAIKTVQAYQGITRSADSAGNSMKTQAKSAAEAALANDTMTAALTGTSSGFVGATSDLKTYQDGLQSGIKKFSDFSTILQQVQKQQDAANKRKGTDATSTSLINADSFNKDLSAANASATTFYSGITKLATDGRTSFATQLAGLGPDAQGILTSALALTPGASAALESNARFAAFLASDAFKSTFTQGVLDTTEAYAQILRGGGSLSDVKAYIDAQTAGVGAAWEQSWLTHHPDLPLNVDLKAPTDDEVALMNAKLSGRVVIKATVVATPLSGGHERGLKTVNQATDALTGAKISLPATLNGAALTASLAQWFSSEGMKPKDIAAKINTKGFSADVTTWIAKNGPVKVFATLVPTNTPASVFGAALVYPGGLKKSNSRGGRLDETGQGIRGFATGGGWGQFSGPGTGTSDSILARVSAGEYINTAASTSFWGPDFFDSLNRKMLPTSFLGLLGSVAGASGNQGPSHVAHVQVIQNNPLTRDPLTQLRQDSEMVANGIWG